MSNILNYYPTRDLPNRNILGIPVRTLPSNYSDNSTNATMSSNVLAESTSGLDASGVRSAAPLDYHSCSTTDTVSALSFFVVLFSLALIGLVIYVVVLRNTVKSMMSIGEGLEARNPLTLLKLPEVTPIASRELGDTNESVQFVAPSTRPDGPHVYLQFEDKHLYSNNTSKDKKRGDHSCMQGVVNNDSDLAQDNGEGNYINVPYNARIV